MIHVENDKRRLLLARTTFVCHFPHLSYIIHGPTSKRLSKFPGRTSAPYSEPFFPFSLLHNRTDDFGASFALLGRKALQPFLQTFATIPANVCNRPRKRLREKMPLFRLYTLYIYNKGAIRKPYLHRICVIWPCKHDAA